MNTPFTLAWARVLLTLALGLAYTAALGRAASKLAGPPAFLDSASIRLAHFVRRQNGPNSCVLNPRIHYLLLSAAKICKRWFCSVSSAPACSIKRGEVQKRESRIFAPSSRAVLVLGLQPFGLVGDLYRTRRSIRRVSLCSKPAPPTNKCREL